MATKMEKYDFAASELQRSDFNCDEIWPVRYRALEKRKWELQEENAELRRQLAGVTPSDKSINSLTPNCAGCLNLKRQKVRQADFFENLLLESRRNTEVSKKECALLRIELSNTRAELAETNSKFKSSIDKEREKAFMYKKRSERLEKRNTFELKGYLKEIDYIKSKLIRIDNALAKVQLKVLNKNVECDLLREVRKLTSDSLSVTENLRDLSSKLR